MENSRSNEKPESLAHQEPCEERRHLVRVVPPERADGEPSKADAGPLPESIRGFEEVFASGALKVR